MPNSRKALAADGAILTVPLGLGLRRGGKIRARNHALAEMMKSIANLEIELVSRKAEAAILRMLRVAAAN